MRYHHIGPSDFGAPCFQTWPRRCDVSPDDIVVGPMVGDFLDTLL